MNEYEMRPLFIALKSEWYEAFRAGTKTHELRKFGARWNFETCFVGRRVTLSHGYTDKGRGRLSGTITAFERTSAARLGQTEQAAWLKVYGFAHSDVARMTIKLDEENDGKS